MHGNKNQTPKNSCNEQCKDFKIVIKGLTKNDKQTFKENAVNEKKHLIAFCIPFNTVHKKIIPYECQECKKSFGHSITLERHIDTVHKKLTPYQCEVCLKSFGQKQNLKRHITSIHK